MVDTQEAGSMGTSQPTFMGMSYGHTYQMENTKWQTALHYENKCE